MDHCTTSAHTLLNTILILWLCTRAFGTELGFVTCGSVVKLLNVRHNVRLHSHDVRYGSGSGQQSMRPDHSTHSRQHRAQSAQSLFRLTTFIQPGSECIWGGGRGRLPGRVDGGVRGCGVGAGGVGEVQAHRHRGAPVRDGRAVRPSHPRSARGARHAQRQPAQLLESHGGRVHEAQRDPRGQGQRQPPPHRVLTAAVSLLPLAAGKSTHKCRKVWAVWTVRRPELREKSKTEQK
ncbi:hypothetical protein COCON_G00077770 [Conger conger]|uniref:Uncharacterized protein n=1 Tax=Conger conger TaxID=82655 RepID=A0A9Q1DNY8_CONCO|nr:hypothetical protein COCON_G00077770 [Conger conger]